MSSDRSFVPAWRQVGSITRALRFAKGRVEWLVLLGLMAVAMLLWFRLKAGSQIMASVTSKVHSVGSTDRGTLATVLVVRGQRVKRGQVLAALHTGPLDAELTLARGEMERLRSLLSSASTTFRLQQVRLSASLSQRSDAAQQALLQGHIQLKRWRVELVEIDREIRYQEKVHREQLGRSGQLGTLRTRRKALRQLIQATPMLLGFLHNKKKRTRRLEKKLTTSSRAKRSVEAILKPIRAQLKIQQHRIGVLEARRKKLTLRAPVQGIVKDILKRSGDPLEPSATVLTIVEGHARHVTAYVRDAKARHLRIGMTAHITLPGKESLRSLFRKPRRIRGRIVGLGEVSPLPQQLQSLLTGPTWVRRVTIEIFGDHRLVPGERVTVTLAGS